MKFITFYRISFCSSTFLSTSQQPPLFERSKKECDAVFVHIFDFHAFQGREEGDG